jgi:hypothetical protein
VNRKRGLQISCKVFELIRVHPTKFANAALRECGASGIEQGVYAIWIYVSPITTVAFGIVGFASTGCVVDCGLWQTGTTFAPPGAAASE